MKLKEILAAAAVVVIAVGVPIFTVIADGRALTSGAPQGAQILTLAGIAENGVWTLENVSGVNYWWKTFDAAVLRVEKGREVVLRLQAADVHHRFYAPELGIGPVDIEAGHTEVVRFRPEVEGVFRYFCTTVCGDCHFHMTGWIVVSSKDNPTSAPSQEALAHVACRHEIPESPRNDMLKWGEYLYQQHACTTCHGENGKGGVANFNYAKKTVAAHNTLAESLHLEEKEDAEAFIQLLLKGADLENLEKRPGIPRFRLVLVKYKAAKDLILKGKHCARKEKTGPEPPLQMRSWREVFTDRDVDAIIAYLLTLYEWEDDEDWPEEEEE